MGISVDEACAMHEAYLIRMQDEAEAKASIRESEIYEEEREILRDHKRVDAEFGNHATNEEIESIGLALAKMMQEYKSTGQQFSERERGILDIFYMEIAPIYERCVTAAAEEKVDHARR